MAQRTYESRYSGPNRSGICVCGHKWEEHHLGIVMNPDYVKGTKEGYIPDECEHYGFNEVGGKEYKDGEWVDHCQSYRCLLYTSRCV